MSKIITRIAAVGAAVAIGAGGLALTAPTADAAKVYKKEGSVTVKEGRKAVREADKQKCLTLREVQKIVKGAGWESKIDDEDNPRMANWWTGKGKAYYLAVEGYDEGRGKCATQVSLVYDNDDVYAWAKGHKVSWS